MRGGSSSIQPPAMRKGDQRKVHVTKPRKYNPDDHAELHPLPLSHASRAVLDDHFAHFAQTQAELQVAAEGSMEALWAQEERREDGGGGGGGSGGGGGGGRKRSRAPHKNEKPMRAASMKPEEVAAARDALSARIAASAELREIQAKREALPVASFKEEILSVVRSNQVVLIAGATGCGKTTQVGSGADYARHFCICKIQNTQEMRGAF